MATFFEKLKMGMGIEAENEPEKTPAPEKPNVKIPRKPRAKKEKIIRSQVIEESKENKKKEIIVKEESLDKDQNKSFETTQVKPLDNTQSKEKNIMTQKEEIKEKIAESEDQQSGQLAVDVYQTEEHLVIQSAIAGVKADGLDITMEGDMVSIKGTREKPSEENERSYFYQECYWGPFSRQILLSVEVDPSRAEASLKEGILSIKIPKIEKDKKRKLVVRE